jgi:hypothetical protein
MVQTQNLHVRAIVPLRPPRAICGALPLSDAAAQTEIVMRLYFEKPRTTTGWKGLINDPHLTGRIEGSAASEKGPSTMLLDPYPTRNG